MPSKRSNPPSLLVAGSIVAAVLIAGATLLVLASLRDTFLSPQEVERLLHLKVLYAPMTRADGSMGAKRRDYGRLIAAIDARPGQSGKAVLLLAPNSRLSLQDSALGIGRALDTRDPGRVLLVRFAEGAAVPTGADALAIDHIAGLATTVIGTAACSNRRLDAKLLGELRALYDYIVVTAPPTAASFDSIELAQTADLAILVLEAEKTRRPVASDLVAQVDGPGAEIIGAVLLGRRQHIPQWVYRLLIERRGATA